MVFNIPIHFSGGAGPSGIGISLIVFTLSSSGFNPYLANLCPTYETLLGQNLHHFMLNLRLIARARCNTSSRFGSCSAVSRLHISIKSKRFDGLWILSEQLLHSTLVNFRYGIYAKRGRLILVPTKRHAIRG